MRSGEEEIQITARRQLWGIWSIFVVGLALLLMIPLGIPSRQDPWHPAQTAVGAFVLAILSLVAAVSTFALREKLREVRATTPDPFSPTNVARVRATLLRLWVRCLVIGLFGGVLAYGAASPAAGWPFVSAAAVLLVFHAPRHWLFTRPPL